MIIKPVFGMDQDSAVNRRSNDSIYESRNMRINSNDGLSLGEWTNIKGTNRIIAYNLTYNLVKIVKVGSYYAIFATRSGFPDLDYIFLVDEQHLPRQGDDPLELSILYKRWQLGGGADLTKYIYYIWKGNLGFSNGDDIKAVGYYESDSVQKIYWTVNNEPLRSLNVIYDEETNDIESLWNKPEALNAIPNAILKEPEFDQTTSGSLKSGRVHYAYKLINAVGGETQLSPLSKGIHVADSSSTEPTDYNYKGSPIDTTTGKGFIMQIEDVPEDFERIKIYAIHYIDDVSLPEIRLVNDSAVTTSFKFSDTGMSLADITPEEFIAIQSLYTTGGNISTMNNRLFMTDYNEQLFDFDEVNGSYWDARAYRFNSSKSSRLYEDNLSTYTTITDVSDWSTIAEDHDAINRSNDPNFWDFVTYGNNYVYQSNGVITGAEGLNIEIRTSSSGSIFKSDTSGEDTRFYAESDSLGYQSSAGEYRSAYRASFKPDEVYRLAIQFRNGKGQLSKPKWICDYKYSLSPSTVPYTNTSFYLDIRTYALQFTVSNIPTDPDTGNDYEWRIVYVPITDEDEGIHFGAFIAPYELGLSTGKYRSASVRHGTYIYSNVFHHASRKGMSLQNDYLEFMSPEYCFGKVKNYVKARVFSRTLESNIEGAYDSTNQINTWKAYNQDSVPQTYFSIDGQYNLEYSNDLEGSIPLDGSNEFLRAGETLVKVKNGYYYQISGDDKTNIFGNSNKGRCQIIKVGSVAPNYGTSVVHGLCYIDNFETKYGGLSYSIREGNAYVELGEFTTSSISTVYGDTYPAIFEYLRQISDNTNGLIADNQIFEEGGLKIKTTADHTPGVAETVAFPVYSRINLKLRHDEYLSKVYLTNGSYLIHEDEGVYEESSSLISPGGSGKSYVNEGNYVWSQPDGLYLYNKTYSRNQDLVTFIPSDYKSSAESYKARIIASGLKVAGEDTDAMLQLNPSTYVDVDGTYGQIIKTIEFANKLYFFQEDAIGIVPVNERQTQTTADGSELVIGNTQLLSRFDYVTRHNGISDKTHVAISASAMYVLDNKRGEILKITDKIEKISIAKNVDSIVKNNYWLDSFVMVNRKYNEVMFFYKATSSSPYYKALVYNETIEQFTSIYDYDSKIEDTATIDYNDFSDELIVADNLEVYSLNDGNYNHIVSSYKSSSITFLISTENEMMALWTALEFILREYDSNGDAQDFFLTLVQIYDENHNSGSMAFNSSRFKKKFGKWRTNSLRNYTGWAFPPDGNGERILSDHIYVKFTTGTNSSSANNRIFFRDLVTHYIDNAYFGT